MPNQLEQLRATSLIVTDSIDLDQIKKFSSTDVNIHSASVLAAILEPNNSHLLKRAIELAQNDRWGSNYKQSIITKLTASIGLDILKNISGRIAIDIDANLSFDCEGIIAKARELANLYSDLRVDQRRILIKIPATWEGIQAVQQLEREQINCSLTFVYSLIQAQACVDVGSFQISVPVGPACNWYKINEPELDHSDANDPGVATLSHIYQNYKYLGYPTRVTGTDFNNRVQTCALAGCDQLVITPLLLDELSKQTSLLERQLIAPTPAAPEYRPSNMTEKEFRWHFNSNAMAHAKLAEDIRSLADIQFQLEQTISQFLEGQS